MSTISDIITSETNYTKQKQAAEDNVTGTESMNLSMMDFMSLLTEQLKYQDPTNTENGSQEFVSEMCQFAQLDVSTETYDLLEDYTGEAKAQSLLGDSVILKDPNSEAKMAGVVEAVYFDGENTGITVNGTTYSMDYLLYSYDQGAIDANYPEGEGETE